MSAAQEHLQLQQVLAWIAADDTPSEAQQPENPDVVHADFSTWPRKGGLRSPFRPFNGRWYNPVEPLD